MCRVTAITITLAGLKPRPVPQAAKKTPADLKRDALAAAADKLGDLGVPQSLKDAAKENAEALAAEENA